MTSKKQGHRGARFWNWMADRYSRKPVPDQRVYEAKLEKSNRLLDSSHEVLEIGCGTGTTAIHHAPKVNRLIAIDYSEKMIEIARRKAREAGVSNVEFEVSSVTEWQCDPARFDVILAHSILHLVPNLSSTLAQINQLLKPNGLLISTTPCIGDFFRAFRYINALGKAVGLMPHVSVFTEEQLKQWLHNAEFEIEQRWLPSPKAGLFLVARKITRNTSTDDQIRIVAK
ncbi:MAG: class I SAM-dependent methyltransferase [Pseudomonadota bacterium]